MIPIIPPRNTGRRTSDCSIICLSIWFVVSYLFGIVLVEPLNNIRIGGYMLGFWFAQQGSIYVFVALIFFYAARMNKLDKQFDVHED